MSNFNKYEEFKKFVGKCNMNSINMGPNIVSIIKNTDSSNK